MYAISSYVVTDIPPTHTQTGQITIHCAAASAQCKNSYIRFVIPITTKI